MAQDIGIALRNLPAGRTEDLASLSVREETDDHKSKSRQTASRRTAYTSGDSPIDPHGFHQREGQRNRYQSVNNLFNRLGYGGGLHIVHSLKQSPENAHHRDDQHRGRLGAHGQRRLRKIKNLSGDVRIAKPENQRTDKPHAADKDKRHLKYLPRVGILFQSDALTQHLGQRGGNAIAYISLPASPHRFVKGIR